MDILSIIKKTLCDILDIDADIITPETYVVRELGAESIDLLELAVSLNSNLGIKIIEDEIFLGSLRVYIEEAIEKNISPDTYLRNKYTFLPDERIKDILSDLDQGPVLKVKDLVDYIKARL